MMWAFIAFFIAGTGDTPAASGPHEVWSADITYIPTLEQGWLFLAEELDLFSKRLVGWKLDDCMAGELVIEAFERAVKLWQVSPQIHHSDRGIQYASKAFCRVLDKHRVAGSMSAKGNCLDNAAMGRMLFMSACDSTATKRSVTKTKPLN